MPINSFSGLSGTIYGLVAPISSETPRQIAPQSLCLVFFWLRLFTLEDHLTQLLILQSRKARPGEMKGLAQDLRTKLGQFQDKNQDPWYWLHHSFPRLLWFSRLASKPLSMDLENEPMSSSMSTQHEFGMFPGSNEAQSLTLWFEWAG